MADKITMDTELLVQLSSQVSQLQNSLSDIAGSISSSISEVRRVAASQTPVINKLTDTKKKTLIAADNANHLSKAIRRSANLWEEAEKKIWVIWPSIVESIFKNQTDTAAANSNSTNYKPVFDENNAAFGAAQNGPVQTKSKYDAYRKIIERNTGRKFANDADLEVYLEKLSIEGCGYVSLIHTIFISYEGRAEEFKKAFGYDMYDITGRPNYNFLLVDLYSATDNKNADGTVNVLEDYFPIDDGPLWSYDPQKDSTGKGTTIEQQENRIRLFLDARDVQYDVENYKGTRLTAQKYQQLVSEGRVKQGELHINVSSYPFPGKLRHKDGTVAEEFFGAHSMTVTGTTEDGLLQVSSGGGLFYIDPNDFIPWLSSYQIIHIHS